MPAVKRKSRDLRTEVLESATSSLRASGRVWTRRRHENEESFANCFFGRQDKRPRLTLTPTEEDRSREDTFFSDTDFVSTQFEPSGDILQSYTDSRDDHLDIDSDKDAGRLEEAAQDYDRRKETIGQVENQSADCGILQSVTCRNFMCHRTLHVDFGPLINFIIGHNGSGKSAVLTAITLCLGGKATSTNRGQSLKSFVREGSE